MKKHHPHSTRASSREAGVQISLSHFRSRNDNGELNDISSVTMLRLPQVCKVTALCRSMVYQLEADGHFPQRVNIGVRSVAWVEAEVQAWLAQRIATCRARPAQRASATSPDRLSQPRAAASNGRILAPSRSASR